MAFIINGIQFISDTHLEHLVRQVTIVKNADAIALLGDIGWIREESYWNFVSTMSQSYRVVFLLSGNHECYGYRVHEVDRKIEKEIEARKYWNVFYLQNKWMEFDNIIVWGGTLWTMPTHTAFYATNDPMRIKDLDIADVYHLHHKAVKSIQKAMAYATSQKKQIVVLSHHAPLSEMNGKYEGLPRESAYATDLSRLFRAPLKGWLCGHTHQNLTVEVNGIVCRANCLGYPDETLEHPYDPRAVLML